MADLNARRANAQLNPWLIVVALLGLACFAPFLAQSRGWWNATALQHEAARTLSAAGGVCALGAIALFGPRRWPVSRRPLDIVVLAILGLSVASGIIAVVTSAGVLLGVSTALPIAAVVPQVLIPVVMIIGVVWAPERLRARGEG